MRVALYARVSTIGKGQDAALQLEELRAVASQRGWAVFAEYRDDGQSGSKVSRPALDQMLADCRAGKVDLVFVWKIDRLGRSLQHLLAVLDDLRGYGVGFVSLRDSGIDSTTAGGRLMLQMIGAFAEFEKAMIVERVRAGVARAQAAGKHCGRPRRELDLRAAQRLLQQNVSIRELAEILHFPRSTLRRRLSEVGVVNPRPPAAQLLPE